MNRDEFLELLPGTLIINKNTNEKCILFSNGMEDGLGNIFHIAIKEVVLADIIFPKNFTDALEVAATKEQEFERIRQKNAIDLESAEAAQHKATAEGQVEIERAKVAGKVAEINAEAEKKRRLSSIAKAHPDRGPDRPDH